MAFRTNHTWQLKPGRLVPEVLPLLQTARAIHVRHGAGVSAWIGLLFGPATGRITYTLEYADQAAFGKSFAAFGADPEWMPLWMKINGPESPVSLVSAFSGSSFRGIDDPAVAVPGPRVRAVRAFRIRQGSMAEARELLIDLRGHLQRIGVPRVRMITPFHGGEVAFQVVSATEFPGLAAYGEVQDKITSDSTFQAFLSERFAGGESPLSLVSSGLSMELPLA